MTDKTYAKIANPQYTPVPELEALKDEHHEEEKEYTNLFFQRPLTFKQAAAWVFVHYFTIGLVQGYFVSVQFNLQAVGATFRDQSTLSLALYPYSFKFLFSPLLDRFFARKVGRSKTHIFLGGIVIGTVFSVLGPTVEGMILNKDIVPMTILFSLINTLICVVQIAGEAWILTMFSKDLKQKASTFLVVGQSAGVILGYNIFTPLNDVAWLNDNIFNNDPRTLPLVSHSEFCIFVAVLYFGQIIFNMLFMAEEKIKAKNEKTLLQIFAVVPKHAINPHMRKFIGYLFASRILFFMVDFSLDLKLVKNGYLNISRSTLSNIDTAVYPIVFVLSFCAFYFIKKGQLIRMYHFNMMFIVMVGVFRYFIFLDLKENRLYWFTFWARVLSGVLGGLDCTSMFMIGFFNTIVNKAVGNTGITCLIALKNQTASIPKTIGLYLIANVEYDLFVGICLGAQMILLIVLFPYALILDRKEHQLYSLFI
jgi:PAT family acetyl-CoA transporter-like MFS transporter 1